MEMLLEVRSFNPNVYNKILGVYKSCLQLRELITELLDFRKQEQGHMTIKVCEHNMVHFIYEHYLLFLEYAAQRQITFNFEKSSNNISVWFDAKQMQKAINNLISNAFKYTKAGGTISIAVRKRNQEVLIEITDNGSGIAEKDIDKYTNESFAADYRGWKFNIEKGCILAIGNQYNVRINKIRDDLANTSSIFSIVPNTDQTENNLLVDLGQQKIICLLYTSPSPRDCS